MTISPPPSSFPTHASCASALPRSASNVNPGVRLAIMAQLSPMTDVTQRLFVELKSKNEETRVRAAYELYDNVLSVSRGKTISLDFL